jgi:hypothetical protein
MESFMSGFKKTVLFCVAILIASSSFAQTTATQLWNSTQVYNGATSPVASISSADPVYTVYYKPVTAAAQDYYINLQTSPDGVNWSTVSDHSIYVAKSAAVGTIYQMTVSAKTVKLRLIATPTNVTFSATGSAWIVN